MNDDDDDKRWQRRREANQCEKFVKFLCFRIVFFEEQVASYTNR